MAIKKDDVFRIADSMFADGVAPTLIGLRAALGSGSFSTLSALLTEWKASSRAVVVSDEDAPEEINEFFQSSLRSMWSKAQELAAEAAAGVGRESDEKIKLAAGREADALELAQHLESENEGLMNKCFALSSELEQCKVEYLSLQREAATCRAREDEVRKNYSTLLAKIRPISVRKDRGSVLGVKGSK